ncbi:MAG TPA: 4-(cytidine 5'-diphospho)-2-C-methyl-D-erythritol kinase [Candidatus Kapabacteria bacterium]|nr:4-(cytidine 5'-diphospho)-2-C-methyl-D-erythritol kinase [Candidatus Kapabacteria bacterium]
MRVELKSPCKVNLILNILGKRPDGFHELETVMHPVGIYDLLSFERGSSGIELTCDKPELPTDSRNLVHRAATAFFQETGIKEGIRIHLAKKIPMEAGLGGGSGNAATALLGLNQAFGGPLERSALHRLAASLGSDVPFFLQASPAIATGRGENVRSLPPFPTLAGFCFFLVHPGFGVSTPWAYKNLSRFFKALNGESGRAERLVEALTTSFEAARPDFYNSLEAPVLEKYPLLAIFQEFLLENGASVALMSGSGSTTFALINGRANAERISEKFKGKFGRSAWVEVVEVHQ